MMEKNNYFQTLLNCVVLLLAGCQSQGACNVQIVIDSYTHNSTLTSGDSVTLGNQLILVCWVVGLPYGTPPSYTWTCPNGPCEVEGYYGRKIYNEHILAVNTTSTSDGGTYTCRVTAAGGQEVTGNFTLSVAGNRVVHSYGRLIPHEFPITDLQQISGPDGIGRITCTVNSGTARFAVNGGQLETGGVSEARNGATATLVVNPSNADRFQNRNLYCTNIAACFFYLFISNANPLKVPHLVIDRVTSISVKYRVRRNSDITTPLVTGYEAIRFGVPMIGEYVNKGRGMRVTISPAVPGAQYRITAWALGDDSKSATPAVVYATTGEAMSTAPRMLSITRILDAGIELNWLPPTEPNGEVHYVIYYTPESATEQSIDTESNLTHYNLTGLERNRVCTNIAVQAVNSAGRSERSAAAVLIERAGTATSRNPLLPAVVSLSVVVLLLITCVALLVLALAVTATKRRQKTQGNKTQTSTRSGPYVLAENDRERVPSGTRIDITSVHNTAQGEEENTGTYAYVEGPVRKIASLREGYQELDPTTMDKNKYQKLMRDATENKDINAGKK